MWPLESILAWESHRQRGAWQVMVLYLKELDMTEVTYPLTLCVETKILIFPKRNSCLYTLHYVSHIELALPDFSCYFQNCENNLA